MTAISKGLEALDIKDPLGQEQIIFQEKNIERIETEESQLRNFTDSQMFNQNTAFTPSQDELTKTLLKISELEKELKKVIDEVKDIEKQILSSAKKLVNVEVTLFPKTVICLGDEELTVEDKYVWPIQAEIVEGEIQLSPSEKSQDV